MLPYDYILIDEIPLSNNGKIITSNLPKLHIEKKSYILPRNEIEMKMSKIWSSILGIESIGINDDFFRIGGDSISAIQLISRIRNELDIIIAIFDIFNYRTIQNICDNLYKLSQIF